MNAAFVTFLSILDIFGSQLSLEAVAAVRLVPPRKVHLAAPLVGENYKAAFATLLISMIDALPHTCIISSQRLRQLD